MYKRKYPVHKTPQRLGECGDVKKNERDRLPRTKITEATHALGLLAYRFRLRFLVHKFHDLIFLAASFGQCRLQVLPDVAWSLCMGICPSAADPLASPGNSIVVHALGGLVIGIRGVGALGFLRTFLFEEVLERVHEDGHILDTNLGGRAVGVWLYGVCLKGIKSCRRGRGVINQSAKDSVLAVKVRQGSVGKEARYAG